MSAFACAARSCGKLRAPHAGGTDTPPVTPARRLCAAQCTIQSKPTNRTSFFVIDSEVGGYSNRDAPSSFLLRKRSELRETALTISYYIQPGILRNS